MSAEMIILQELSTKESFFYLANLACMLQPPHDISKGWASKDVALHDIETYPLSDVQTAVMGARFCLADGTTELVTIDHDEAVVNNPFTRMIRDDFATGLMRLGDGYKQPNQRALWAVRQLLRLERESAPLQQSVSKIRPYKSTDSRETKTSGLIVRGEN
jgi:hypothetical protein